MLSAALQLIFAHEMALVSHIF
jgi:hypothetical protein